MIRTTSIVPRGFEISAHPVFLSYQIPEIRSVCIETREIVVEKDDIIQEKDVEEKHHCPICLRRFEDPVTMVECQHSFCVECINIWFQTRVACPICNAESCGYVQCSDNSEKTSSDSIIRTWTLWSTRSNSTASLDQATAILAMKEHTLLLQNQLKEIQAESQSAPEPEPVSEQVEKKRKKESSNSPTGSRTAEKKKKKKRQKQGS